MAIDHVRVIEDESARIVAAVDADQDGRVPWSERWTVGTVAKHVGGTHTVLTQVIEGRPTADFGLFATLEAPDKTDPGLGAWLGRGTAALVEQLRSTDPAEECWSWYQDDRTIGFWQRRMAHETLVHRWDAEAGAGVAGAAMDPEVAADAIDEYLDIFVGASRGLNGSPAGPSIAFECTDTDATWLLQLPAAGERLVAREPGESAVGLRGPAEGVLLVAWGRLSPDDAGVDVVGDGSVLERWGELIPPM